MPSAIVEIFKLSNISPHKEVCGLVDSSNKIYPIKNVSAQPNDFVFDKAEYFNAKDKIKSDNQTILCVYHSHLTGDPTPSPTDLLAINRLKLNYLIVATNTKHYTYTEYSQCPETYRHSL